MKSFIYFCWEEVVRKVEKYKETGAKNLIKTKNGLDCRYEKMCWGKDEIHGDDF